MKTLSKIKLNQISKNEMEKRQMNALRGGSSGCQPCSCVCVGGGDSWADSEGPTSANTATNEEPN